VVTGLLGASWPFVESESFSGRAQTENLLEPTGNLTDVSAAAGVLLETAGVLPELGFFALWCSTFATGEGLAAPRGTKM
jgi:hypothetical protein